MQQPVNGNIEHKLCEKREELCTVVSTAIFQVFQIYVWAPTVMTEGKNAQVILWAYDIQAGFSVNSQQTTVNSV